VTALDVHRNVIKIQKNLLEGKMKKSLIFLLVVLLPVIAFTGGQKEKTEVEFPTEKPIRLVVPFGAGGGSDIASRVLASVAPEFVGQRVDVVCMPGAGGQEALNFVMQQPADGYTLLMTDYGPLIMTALTEKVNYEFEDWIPVFQIAEAIPTFFVHSDSPIKSIEDWIKILKAEPESLSIAPGRHLSTPHLPLILFEQMAGIKNKHVPTTGGSEARAFVLGKKVDLGASFPSTLGPLIKSGDFRALGVCSEERVASLPDVPTMRECGYDVVLPAWMIIFAPKGVPEDRINYLGEKFTQALETDSGKALAKKTNVVLKPNTTEKLVPLYKQTINNLTTILSSIEQ